MRRSSRSWLSKASVGSAALLLLAVVAACTPDPGWLEQRRLTMGTWVDTVYSTRDANQRERIDAELDALLERFAIDYYAWADGELARANAALASGSSFQASPELAALLQRARAVSRSSEAYFDPGVGALVEAWGFHSAQSAPGEPAAEFLERWQRDHASIADLHLDGQQISTARRDLVLDLGGIAKGDVVDRMLDVFLSAGISDVLVNAGGDVRVLGMRGTREWRLGIQSPRAAALLGSIALSDGEAAFTSGDYERFVESDSGRAHHLLDPVSGRPATHTRAVTVIADNGALADAAATALFVAGPVNWRRVAAALDVGLVLRVDASGAIEMTPGMRERVRMQGTEEPATIP